MAQLIDEIFGGHIHGGTPDGMVELSDSKYMPEKLGYARPLKRQARYAWQALSGIASTCLILTRCR